MGDTTRFRPPTPLARILHRERSNRGWDQKEVVRRAGWDPEKQQGYYSSLERGIIREPSDDKLAALDTAFELEPGTIKGWLDADRFSRDPEGAREQLHRLADTAPESVIWFTLGALSSASLWTVMRTNDRGHVVTVESEEAPAQNPRHRG